jgi:hypothetical protein
VWLSLKLKLMWTWGHRTKCLGLLACGIAYCQNNLAMLGKILPPALQGVILGFFGIAAFALGLYNTFAHPDREPPT